MTRAERLAQQEAKAKAKRNATQTTLAQIQAARRVEERKALHKRHALVGQMAEAAGLLALSDADLAGLFAALPPLAQVPNPVAVLAALLADGVCPALESVEGMADLAVVSALRADLALAQKGVSILETQENGANEHGRMAHGPSAL